MEKINLSKFLKDCCSDEGNSSVKKTGYALRVCCLSVVRRPPEDISAHATYALAVEH